LDAIRALQYEGTKVEIAQVFKEQGNEMVKDKKWGDAKEFYTKAIAVLTDKSEAKWEKGADPGLDAKKEKELEEQCFTNRALCNLELSMSDLSRSAKGSAYQIKRITDQPPSIVPQLSGSIRTTSRRTIVQQQPC